MALEPDTDTALSTIESDVLPNPTKTFPVMSEFVMNPEPTPTGEVPQFR